MAGLLVVSSCKKEEPIVGGLPENAILLDTENFGSNDKTVVNGTSVNWKENDTIRLNQYTCIVRFTGSHQAYADCDDWLGGELIDQTVFGYSPISIVGNDMEDWFNPEPTVTIPSRYHSTYNSNGDQVLNLPMVAYADLAHNVVSFKHLTAALLVSIKNTESHVVYIDSVVVTSRRQQLCGSKTISLIDRSAPVVTPFTTTTVADRSVTVYFDHESLSIAAGGDDIKSIQVPILPINARANDLTLKVFAHGYRNDSCVKALTDHIFNMTADAVELGRNVMLQARVNLGGNNTMTRYTRGRYTIDANNTKVFFSQGDLQFCGSDKKYIFAENQWISLGASTDGTGNSAIGDDRATQTIDLFGFGATGYNNVYPWLASTTNDNYPGAIDMADWGRFASHRTGDYAFANGISGDWRCLSGSELEYILTGRTTVTNRYLLTTVAGVKGLLLFPDEFTWPGDVVNYSAVSSDMNGNGYYATGLTVEQFVRYFEASGCIFLPVTGYRVGETNVYYSSDRCYYWMGDLNRMNLDVANHSYNISDASSTRYYGMGVRLVHVTE